MSETYEKRLREKRKQRKRSEKLERKRDPETVKPEVSAEEYLLTPEDRERLAEEARKEREGDDA